MTPGEILTQVVVPIITVGEGLVIGYLLTARGKRADRIDKAIDLTADTLVAKRIAELDPEGRFITQLLKRVEYLEQSERERLAQAEARTERITRLESEKSRLEANVQALKYELAAKLNAALGPIQRQAAALLSEAAAKEEQK